MRRLLLLATITSAVAACAEPPRLPEPDLVFRRDLTVVLDLAPPPGDGAAADLAIPDASTPDIAAPDLATPDLATPDLAAPDLAVRDLTAPDLSRPDLAAPDLAMPDLAAVDLATPDLANVRDLRNAPKLQFLGNTGAFVSGTGAPVALEAGSAPAKDTVSITTQTWPPGSVAAVYLRYVINDPKFGNADEKTMTFDGVVGNNERWFAIIPQQPAGTRVIWYLRAVGWDGATLFDSNFGANWDYTTN